MGKERGRGREWEMGREVYSGLYVKCVGAHKMAALHLGSRAESSKLSLAVIRPKGQSPGYTRMSNLGLGCLILNNKRPGLRCVYS